MSRLIDITTMNDPYGRHLVVSHNESKQEVDLAMQLPAYLTSPDGRVFSIKEWHPHVVVGNVVAVTIEAHVEVPDSNGDTVHP